jgi:hypothetical protein
MGVGATARNSRHFWQSRLCGPSDRNSRSHRKQSLRFILVRLRTGFTRAFMTRGISTSYLWGFYGGHAAAELVTFSPASADLDRPDGLPPASSWRIQQILYHREAPGKCADARCAAGLAANILAEWQPTGIIPLALRSLSPLPAFPYLFAYQ